MIPNPEKPSILDIPLKRWFPLNLETLMVVLLLLMAVVSRFYDLGVRTVSHDEINHVVPSFDLYAGRGYRYDPMSHGPLQFHMMALSYAVFGDNDFTTRLPAALFGVASIAVAMLAFRRYLGRTGAILAGLMMLISPFLLFYGRYARNEIYIVMWALLTLYSILRYFETGEAWAFFLFTAVNALHFTDKATSYMFAVEEFVFLLLYFVDRVARREWSRRSWRTGFLAGLAAAIFLGAVTVAAYLSLKPVDTRPAVILLSCLAAVTLAALVWSVISLFQGIGLDGLRAERSLDMLVMLVTFVLPLAGAVPLEIINSLLVKAGKPGFAVLDYTTAGALRVTAAAVSLGLIGTAIGLFWFRRKWLYHAAVFFVPFVLLYSTFFTNADGLVGGLVGALSYWSEQQGVARGGQPLYYYALLLIPLYEFLPAFGTLAAMVIAPLKKLWQSEPGQPFTPPQRDAGRHPVPVAALLVFWSVSSLAIFTYAGEKMPWLTTHLTLPMILASAWAFGWMIETIPWGRLAGWGARNYVRAIALAFFGLLGVLTARAAFRAAFINYDYPLDYVVYAHAAPYPKQLFYDIEELSIRTTGTTDIVVAYDNYVRYPYWWYMRRYPNKIDYDVNPTRALRQAVVITVGDPNYLKLTPVVRQDYVESDFMRLWWPNMDYWSLKWSTIVIEANLQLPSKVEDTPKSFKQAWTDAGQYVKAGWGYLKQVWKHIQPFFTDPKVRSAVWQIWFNRDYTQWAALKNSEAFTLENWGVADRMRIYIRKDIDSLLWPYGVTAQAAIQTDPYAEISSPVAADARIGIAGLEPGQFEAPRAIVLAADGSLYVADSLNGRIQHLSAQGEVLQIIGEPSPGNAGPDAGPQGTFREPWGVALGPDGSIYVADTWNHRIQKFTADGKFLAMWGTFGQDGAPTSFYGPRGIAVDLQGRVFVADTGNKRIVVFDPEGNFLAQFGTPGMGLGQLDEPVAVAVSPQGLVYVTDTWNQRIQIFAPDGSGNYSALNEWLVDGWYGQSPENKPFITLDAQGYVYVTDPEACRVIIFSPAGKAVRVLDGCSTDSYQRPSGIAPDGAGGIWVSDSSAGTLFHFKVELP